MEQGENVATLRASFSVQAAFRAQLEPDMFRLRL